MKRRKNLTAKEIELISSGKANFENLSDNGKVFYHVVGFREGGSEESFKYLMSHLKPIVDRLKSGDKYFIKGSDAEDIEQECNIQLISAAMSYDPYKNPDFKSYCRIKFHGRIVSLLQESTRYKNLPLNFAQSLHQPFFEDESGNPFTYEDTLHSDELNFLEQLCLREYHSNLTGRLNDGLSDLEERVFELYIHGYSYQEGSNVLNINKKSFGNAIQRVKGKIIEIFKEDIEKEKEKNKNRHRKKKKS